MMKPLLWLTCAGGMLAFACSPKSGAVVARVELDPALQASCVTLQVRDPSGAELGRTSVERGGKNTLSIAVVDERLPQEVDVQARALTGNGCQEPLTAVAVSEEKRATLSAGKVEEVELLLKPTTPLAAIAFVEPPEAVTAGACTRLQVEARDADGRATVPLDPLTVQLGGSPADGAVSFHLDPACGTPTPSVVLAAGSERVAVYVRATRTGTYSLSAQAEALEGTTTNVEVRPAAPARLAFLQPPASLVAGQCSSPLTVQLQDAFGNASAALASVSVLPSASPSGGFTFHDSGTCAAPASAALISAGGTLTTLFARGTAAGVVTLTATGAGLQSGSAEVEVVAGSPTGVGFASAPQTVIANSCSAVVRLQSQDTFGNAAVLSAPKTFNLTANAGIGFYTDPACGSATTSVTLAAGTAEGGFYFRANAPGTVTISATSGSSSASQSQTIIVGPPAQLAFAPATPQTWLAGQCGTAEVVLLDQAGNATTTPVAVSVTLSAAPASIGASFFSDAACTNALAGNQVQVPPGQSKARYYVRGVSGAVPAATLTTTASATGLTSGMRTDGLLPLVRTGTCTLPTNQTTVTCNIAPAVQATRSVLWFQAVSAESRPSMGNVHCTLGSTGASLACSRESSGAVGELDVRWQVAEFARNVKVEHHEGECNGAPLNIGLNTPFDTAASFLLHSASGLGNDHDGPQMLSARFTGPQAVVVQNEGSLCSNGQDVAVQAVQFTGAKVDNGTAIFAAAAASASSVAAAIVPERTALLYAPLSSQSHSSDMCSRMVRGYLDPGNATQVLFARGGETPPAECTAPPLSTYWQRIEFPTGTTVATAVLSMEGTAVTTQTGLPAGIDPSRTVVFAGGQWASGQATGEGQLHENGATGDVAGNMQAEFWIEGGNVRARRKAYPPSVGAQTPTAPARWTVFLVQFTP